MKRLILISGIAVCILLTSSCRAVPEVHLNPSNYGEDFRIKNEALFLNTECEHFLIHTPMDGADADICHKTSCKWGGCDYAEHKEPHTFLFSRGELPSARAYYKENGYLYHSFRMSCEDCHGVIMLHVLCRTQKTECGAGNGAVHAPAECFAGCDWQDIFRETPYRITVRSEA
ncbi:MAG: hypothetical protein IKD07_00650 [Clostridia bacterium]|nr:hypothetical protein [Clostridia bacterium]